MNILDAVSKISKQLHLDSSDLLRYMDEDSIGGYHVDPTYAKWHIGSMWAVEAQLIYAIIRATKPERILEIGVNYGCSTAHILTALQRNDKGLLYSVDIEQPKDMTLISPELQTRWIFNMSEGADWIVGCKQTFDIVLEDAGHDFLPTRRILRAVKSFLNPHIVISHDTEHRVVGSWVSQAFDAAFGKSAWSSYLIDPSDCGLGIWTSE